MLGKIIIVTILFAFMVGGLFMVLTGGFINLYKENTETEIVDNANSFVPELDNPGEVIYMYGKTDETMFENESVNITPDKDIQTIKLTLDDTGKVVGFEQISGKDKIEWKEPK